MRLFPCIIHIIVYPTESGTETRTYKTIDYSTGDYMIKSFLSYDAAISFSTQAGYHGSKPFKRLTWHNGSQVVVWCVQIHWRVSKDASKQACQEHAQNEQCSQM